MRSVAVRPSSAVEKYRNQDVDPRRAGKQLNVSVLLTGSYLRDGVRLRVNVQLIDVKANRVLWQDTLDTAYDDLFRLQDRVAEQIIRQLRLHVSAAEAGDMQSGAPITPEAYEDYLRGVDLYGLNDFAGAIRLLEKSAGLDPNYALTWAHLGQAYTTNASLEFGGRKQYEKAQAAYEKALSLNPELMEARVYMANLFTDTGRVERSVPLLRAVLARNPNNAGAHWELGYAYRFAGMLPDSLRECLRAREIDPQVKLYSSAINTYLYLQQYRQFVASLPATNTVYILFYRGFGEYYANDEQAALSHFDQAFNLNPLSFQAQLGEALASHIRHNDAQADRILLQTEARVQERGVADPEGLFKLAEAFALAGDKKEGVKMFRAAVDGGFFCYPLFRTDPLLDSLRRESGFTAIVDKARERHDRFVQLFGH